IRQESRGGAYGKSVCAVRGGGGWRRTHAGTAPVLDPTSNACSTDAPGTDDSPNEPDGGSHEALDTECSRRDGAPRRSCVALRRRDRDPVLARDDGSSGGAGES